MFKASPATTVQRFPLVSGKRGRRFFLGLLVVGALLLWFFLYDYYFYAPRNAWRFVNHICEKRIEDAKAMMPPEELQKIPEWYWEELLQRDCGEPPRYYIGGVCIPLINNEIPFWLAIPVDEGTDTRDGRFVFIADGRVIRVGETAP